MVGNFHMKAAVLHLSLLLFLSSALHAEIMTLEDLQGRKLEAELVSLDGQSLTVTRTTDKKTFTLQLANLMPTSRLAVEQWKEKGGSAANSFSIAVSIEKNGKKTSNEDFDDKRVNLEPVITLTNMDSKRPSGPVTVTALFLGKPVLDVSAMYVFRKETIQIPELEPSASKDLEIGKISAAYDDRGYAKHGARYSGYVILVHEPGQTKIYASKSIPASLVESNASVYFKLESKKSYDKNFKELNLPKYSDD
jgi:hypothetical protein